MTPPRRLPSLCYKTRMCKFFAVGACNRGDQCTFAHKSEDLCPVPDLTRTQVCPALINTGYCEDETCTFAHDALELRKGPFGVASLLIIRRRERALQQAAGRNQEGAEEDGMSGQAAARQQVPAPAPAAAPEQHRTTQKSHKKRAAALEKTRLCVYNQAGRCFKKDGCNFAHSLSELRDAPRAAHRAPASEGLRALLSQQRQAPPPMARQPPHMEAVNPYMGMEAAQVHQMMISDDQMIPHPAQTMQTAPMPSNQNQANQDMLCIKNTFLEVGSPTYTKPLRRSSSAPQLHKLQDEIDALSVGGLSDNEYPIGRKISAPAALTSMADAARQDPPGMNAGVPTETPPDTPRSQDSFSIWSSPHSAAAWGPTPTPMMWLSDACVEAPGMGSPLMRAQKMNNRMVVPVCAIQQINPLVEVPAVHPSDMFVLPPPHSQQGHVRTPSVELPTDKYVPVPAWQDGWTPSASASWQAGGPVRM